MLLPKFARGYTKHRKGVVFGGDQQNCGSEGMERNAIIPV